MTGCARLASDADVASSARARLDAAAAAAAAVDAARLVLVRALLALWPTAAWLAAGATSAKRWLIAYTHCSAEEAHRLERLSGLCHRHPALADAVLAGRLPLCRADRLGALANPEREPWLADSLPAFLRLADQGVTDDDWSSAARHWADLVDQERTVRQVPRHSVALSQRLFGGGEIHGDLSPAAFLTVATALDAWTDDPDPQGSPHRRSPGERRADALDDLCRASLHARGWEEPELEDIATEDPFDGWAPIDDLDDQLDDDEGADLDDLALLRRRLQRAERCERRRDRRRTRPRSGVRVNVHVDLRTLAGLRDHTDLDHLVHRADGWQLTRSAAEQLLCDTARTAVLFDGPGRILDANDATERWTPEQRRTIAARDRHCVFPSCTRPPRHCDVHHLHHREHGGPTRIDNGALLLCRHHHRLLHHGWRLHVHDGRWVATDPHGTAWTGRPAASPPHDTRASRAAGPPRPTAKTPG